MEIEGGGFRDKGGRQGLRGTPKNPKHKENEGEGIKKKKKAPLFSQGCPWDMI
jgi:hypothetical protein